MNVPLNWGTMPPLHGRLANETEAPRGISIDPRMRQFEQHLRDLTENRLGVLVESARFRESEDPIEAIHQLRVASRRLRAVFDTFGDHIHGKRHERTRKLLRGITRGAGALREWDVHSETIAELVQKSSSDVERAALEHILERIDVRRGIERKATVRALKQIQVPKLRRRMQRVVEAVLRDIAFADVSEIAWLALEPRVHAVFAEAPPLSGPEHPERMHNTRIRVKKLRYAIELVSPALGEHAAGVHQYCQKLQKLLGRYHDLDVLHDVLRVQRDDLASRRRTALVGGLDPLIERVKEQKAESTRQYHELGGRYDRRGLLMLIGEGIDAARVARVDVPSVLVDSAGWRSSQRAVDSD